MHKSNSPVLAGVLGFFDDPESLTAATAKVRDSNFKNFDCYTPFAVHGLDKVQGLPRSKVSYVTGIVAFSGAIFATWLQYAASKTWWPHVIAGKPFNSLPAFVPVIFESAVLLGGLSTFFAMAGFNRLPNFKRRAFDPSLTNDRFAILIEAPKLDEHDADAKPEAFSPDQAESFLKSLGAKDTRKVFEEGWF